MKMAMFATTNSKSDYEKCLQHADAGEEDSGTVIMALKSTVTSMVTMGSADDVGSVADGDN